VNKVKILIVGPAWVGDMVMAQVLFMLIKQQNPAAILDVLAPVWTQGLLERMPEVSNTWILPFKHGELKLAERYALGKKLSQQNYAQVIILPNSLKSALVPFWSKIPVRTAWSGEWPRRYLLNDVRTLDKTKLPLMIQRFAALGLSAHAKLPEKLPLPALKISAETLAATLKKYTLSPTKKLLALAPGAEFGPSKRWPAKYYAEVANAKIAQGWDVWLFGSPNDQTIAAEIMALTENRAIDLVGQTSLAEAVDLLSLATAVVSNDSGLMHIAAAVGRPLIAIYGSTSTRFTPPLSDQVIILSLGLECSPCFKRECPLGHWRCMRDLQPGQVLESLDKLMNPSNGVVE